MQRPSTPAPGHGHAVHAVPATASDSTVQSSVTPLALSDNDSGSAPAALAPPQLDTIMEDHDPFDNLAVAEDASFARTAVRWCCLSAAARSSPFVSGVFCLFHAVVCAVARIAMIRKSFENIGALI